MLIDKGLPSGGPLFFCTFARCSAHIHCLGKRMQQGAVGRVSMLVMLGAGAIIGALIGGDVGNWLHWICKPLATGWLLLWVSGLPGLSSGRRYRRWIVAGLALSLVGDVLLMMPWGLFVPGLVAFLLAHLCYISAFLPGTRTGSLLAGLAISTFIAGTNLVLLWPYLPTDMQLPVGAYVAVIGAMASMALARAFDGLQGGRMSAVGALLFVISDCWLAWDRFAGPLPWAIAGILVTYWSAQWAIAASAVSDSSVQ